MSAHVPVRTRLPGGTLDDPRKNMSHHLSDHDSLFDALSEKRGIRPGRLRLEVNGRPVAPDVVCRALDALVSEERRRRIEEVLDGRTRTVTPVVEGTVNMGNVSAVMRTAEALGFQELHLVTGEARFKDSPRTSTGAEKWLDVHAWTSAGACVDALRARGYRIVATNLDPTARGIEDLDFTKKTALVFGNERDGVSREMLAAADERCFLPMTGFAQSYNISVAAAIALYHAYRDRMARSGYHGDLTDDERDYLRAVYFKRSVRHADQILRRVLADEEAQGPG